MIVLSTSLQPECGMFACGALLTWCWRHEVLQRASGQRIMSQVGPLLQTCSGGGSICLLLRLLL